MATLLPSLDEGLLLERARQNDELAFRCLYGRHAAHVAGVVYRLLGDDAELEDIVQDAFVDAARSLNQLRDVGSLRAWLVRIAVRRVYRHLAQRSRSQSFLQQLAQLAPFLGRVVSDPADGDLYEALRQLPASLRVPWTLRHVEQLTVTEVAEATSCSLSTTKRRIAEGQARLERFLGGTSR